MQRSDEGKCIDVEGRSLFRLRTLIGWWWYRCLFFDDCRHHKLISLTRELASPRVSLPYSAKCAPVLLSIEELLGVRKRPQMYKIEINIPKSQSEQQAIANILSDMDAEIAGLEQKRDKTRALKQGMMQELLTGKTRLI